MNAIKVNAPIATPGAVGYLLWLRRDMPRVYLNVMRKVPAVARFEHLLRSRHTLGCCGLGDDLSPIQITARYLPDPTPLFSASDVLPPIDYAPVSAPSFWSQIGSVAANVGQGAIAALPGIASIVRAAAPIAIVGMQTNAALRGAMPYQTGYFNDPQTGGRYLSAVATPYSTSIMGNIPTWALLAAGLGAVILVTR